MGGAAAPPATSLVPVLASDGSASGNVTARNPQHPTPLRLADATGAQLDAGSRELARITQAHTSSRRTPAREARKPRFLWEALQQNRKEHRLAFNAAAAAVAAAGASATSGPDNAQLVLDFEAADGRLAIARLAIQLHRRAKENATAENAKLHRRATEDATENAKLYNGIDF